MNINKTIKFLLGKSSTQDTNDCVPSYLSSKYDREGAAFFYMLKTQSDIELLLVEFDKGV